MIRNKKHLKTLSWVALSSFAFQLLFPSTAYALTGGPSQPEVQSFEPIGTNQMVDPFSGDFTYNIPLLDAGGYPINLSYHSGIGMDQEASWVGLGWNVNPGVINRNLRGIPDDFRGDEVSSEMNMKMNQTFGLSANVGLEIFGLDSKKIGGGINFGLGINYNTYNGVGIDLMAGVSPSVNIGKSGQEVGTAGLGLSMRSSSNDGLTISPSLSFSKKMQDKQNGLSLSSLSSNVGTSINSRGGMTSMSYGVNANFSFSKFTPNPDADLDNLENLESLEDLATASRTSSGASIGSSISFVPNTYVPQQKFPFESGNYSASFKVGGEIFGVDGTFDISGYYTYQKLMENNRSSNAYGYLNSEYAVGNDKAMLDFNREKDRGFTAHTPNLPLTNFTYDLFGISGQGISGMFRGHRGDIGYVYDPKVNNTSASFNLGAEVGVGNLVKFGADGSVNTTVSHTGIWKKGNANTSIAFQKQQPGNMFEPSFLKMVGEKTLVPSYWRNKLNSHQAQRVNLIGNNYNVRASNVSILKSRTSSTNSNATLPERTRRNQLVSTLTKAEVRNGMGTGNYVSNHGRDHHIGEVTVLRTDGSRYIYGLPAYNFKQKGASFNVSGNSGKNCTTGLIDYDNTDASKGNKKGKDNFYQSNSTPAYAHSYLLTSLLSSDYADFDGIKGPSDGDMGNYVKFDYRKIPTYRWRVPYQRYKAGYSEGLQSIASDDMGNYQYGEKELFYVDKIVSKSHVTVFHTSPRNDAKGVMDEDGGYDVNKSASMLKLDSISLYSKAEYSEYYTTGNVTPIKRVHFEYDYSLCQGVPNNPTGGGKLTLKKVYFTYGNSYKAKFSSYDFTYTDLDHNGIYDDNANPNYNLKGYNRWGNYKPNSGNCGINQVLTAAEYPYVEQNKADEDRYAASWSLTDISMPSGGTIQIDYESDDYAYVQDKRAMQMFKIVGSGSSATDFNPGSPSNILYNGKVPREYLFFQLNQPEPQSSYTNSQLREDYFDDILTSSGKLYFRFMMNLNSTWQDGNFDFVSGYSNVSEVGLFTGNDGDPNNYVYGYIKLPKVKKGDKGSSAHDAHPISRAAWNFARSHNPELAYSSGQAHTSTNPSSTNAEDIFYELLDVFKNFGDFFKGPNGALRSDDYGRKFHTGKSWVRLYNPNHKKLGGGVRVKKIAMTDEWSYMTNNETNSQYGQEYDYTLDDGTSSGVASYEPMGGGDENPFRQPVFFSEERLLAPDDQHYMEKPFGESFFPSPSVGYSQVTVKNLQRNNVTQHATGKIVHEFYTAKDFPTLVDQTDLQVKHKPASFLSKMLKFNTREHMNTSQGYVVETNDMHGKPKAQWVYAEGESSYLSGVEYKYKTKEISVDLPMNSGSAGATPKRTVLDNEVKVQFEDNTIATHEMGVDYDIVNDFRESYSKSQTGGLNFNISTFFVGIFPAVAVTLIPSYSRSVNQYRSAVTTKVINRFAIQDETIVYDANSIIKTKNTLWDAETGEVLLTEVENEYNESIYNYNYPAHFAYDGMRSAYRNIGYEEVCTLQTGSLFQNILYGVDPKEFRAGDEVMVIHQGEYSKAWVLEEVIGDYTKQYLVDKYGTPIHQSMEENFPIAINETINVKVIRSGYRNQMSQNIGKISLRKNPVQSNNTFNVTKTTGYNPEIVNASATEFSERWHAPIPPIGEGGTVYDMFWECDTFNPDIIPTVSASFTDLLVALTHHQKLLVNATTIYPTPTIEPPKTFTLNSITSGTAFSSADITTLNDALITPIPLTQTVYLTVQQEVIDVLQWTYYWSNPIQVGWKIRPQRFIRLNFHNASSSIENHGYIAIDDPLGNVCYTDSEFEDILSVNTDSLDYHASGAYLHIDRFQSTFNLSDQTTSCMDANFLPFIVQKCGLELRCPDQMYAVAGVGTKVNPYVVGLRGNWRPKDSYAYLTTRDYTGSNPVLRNDATYNSFSPFWTPVSNNPWLPNTASINADEEWTRATTISKYDEFGNEVENKDAMGNYSSAIFDFNGTLATAVANNAQFGQTAYESFENYYAMVARCKNIYDYFSIKPQVDDGIYNLSEYEAHTGYYSLEIPANDTVTYTCQFETTPCTPAPDDIPYTYKDCDKLGVFGEYRDGTQGYSYKVSYWVKSASSITPVVYPNDVELEIVGIGGSNAIIASKTKRYDIIDGWQKIEHYYDVPATQSGTVEFLFKNDGSIKYYLDDLRIHPVNSSMKSFAYNPKNLRLMAELDENNYATFYEYDEEGALIRIKKETDRGIETIQENRNHTSR